MIDIRFVYLERPAKCGAAASGFTAKYSQTLKLLEAELRQLRAKEITIQAGFKRVRDDGWPYSSSKPDHPAVALQFRAAKGVLVFRAHRYSRFEDNLRAIAMTLQALRAVDRWGVVEGQQYTGFRQIEAPAAEDKMTDQAAAAWLAFFSDYSSTDLLGSREKLDLAYKQTLLKLHPDRQDTGSHEGFVKTKQAYELLSKRVR